MNQDASPEEGVIPLAEVLACLGLASDLATGVPMEHSLRRVLLATWLGEELGLSSDELHTSYYVALLGSLGCVINSAAVADYVRDEIRFRGEMFTLDVSNDLRMLAFSTSHVAGQAPWTRLAQLVRMPLYAIPVCRDVAVHIGRILDLSPEVREAQGQCDEHWDGKGTVLHLKGEEISMPARLFLLAQDIEVFDRAGGPEAAMAVVRERSGKYYDPHIASLFCERAPQMLRRLHTIAVWEAVLDAEPQPGWKLTARQFDTVLGKIGDVVDLRSVFTVGHSHHVATLAGEAARILGLPESEVTALQRAALIHDLGRMGVPVATWEKKGSVSPEERQQMQSHASLTELMVARSPVLSPLGTIAGSHHERLDGSGYRGMSAGMLPLSSRLLAAADVYATKLELRPHRAALTSTQASEHLQRQADEGRLDPDAAEAVQRAAGQRVSRAPPAVSGLTERETAVLRLLVRGLSNREIGAQLYLSPKTVGHHIESMYAKIGVSTRVGATLFAVQHGLTKDLTSFTAK